MPWAMAPVGREAVPDSLAAPAPSFGCASADGDAPRDAWQPELLGI